MTHDSICQNTNNKPPTTHYTEVAKQNKTKDD